MNFWNAIQFYFRRVFDFTTVSVYLLVILGFCIILKKKDTTKAEILKLSLFFVICFVSIVLESSLMFAFSTITFRYLFNFNLPFIVLLLSIFMLREKAVTKWVKTAVLVSTLCITEVLSKYLGVLVGIGTSISFLVSLARIAPTLLYLAICFLIRKFDISHYQMFSKETLVICYALSFVLILISVFEHIYESHEITVCTLMSSLDVALLLILDIIYIAIYSIVENRHKITNLEVQNTLIGAEKLSIAIDQNNREELEKIRHDIKNQLSYVGALLQQDKEQEAIHYIDNYVKNQEVLFSFSCSNNVVNSIINLELSKAKIYNVKMDLKVVIPPVLPFEDNDVVSLLTNMIDNALENYYKGEEDAGISVCILKQNDYIRFFVSNPIDPNKYDKNNITRTRKSGKRHGYGTKIIKNIADKYNGFVDFSLEGNHFICDVLLYMNLKE